MIKHFFKPFAFIIFIMALFTGNHSVAWAEPFNNNVKECMKQPDKCGEETAEKQQDNQGKEAGRDQAVGISFWDVAKMIGALIFVIALIYFLLRFINQKSRSYQQTKLIQHIGGTPLGGNRSVQIVKVGSRLLVLGVGEEVKLLKEIDDQKEHERILAQYNEQMDQMIQPKDIMTKWFNKMKEQSQETAEDQAGFKQVLENRLSDMKKERQQTISKLKRKENQQDE